MSRLQTAMKNDLQMLKLLRDEIRLQAHLLKADTKDQWGQLEEQWHKLQAHVDRAEVAVADARKEVDAAGAQLVDSLKKGYTQVKQALKS